MHLKHACLPISPPEQVENGEKYTKSDGGTQVRIWTK